MRKLICAAILGFSLLSAVLLAQQPDGPPAVVPEKIYTPESSVLLALADLKSLPPEVQPYIRYLSLYNIPKDQRDDYARCVSFTVNSLGRRRKLYIPQFVGASDKTVIRINIKDYDWPADAFEKLAREGSGVRPFPEPYFHALIVKEAEITYKTIKQKKTVVKEVEKLVQVGVYANTGQPYYERRKVKEEVEVEEELKIPIKQENKKVVFAAAPWINAEIMGELIALTQSEAPIVRADWFIANALLPPAYYNFLALGNKQEDFDKLIFADVKLAAKARSQDRGIVIQSAVTRNNRILERSPTFTGGYFWQSYDFNTSIKGNRLLNDLVKDKFDASEQIGSLSNGLQAYFLTNAAGQRQDAAPIDIAVDNSAVDRVVRNGRSCIICHAEGIKPFEDEVRSLNKWNPHHEGVRLLITKEKDAYNVDDLFGSNLDKQVAIDQQRYSDAVSAATGLTMQVNAKIYAKIYDGYIEHLMTREDVARDLGLTIADLNLLLKLSNDPVILGLVREPIRPIRRDQFEESFQGFMLVILAAKQRPGDPIPRIVIPEKIRLPDKK